MTIGIINVLQVIQVKHENRCRFKRLRRPKTLVQRGVESSPVQQVGQNVIVAFMLYFQPFQGLNGHIPDNAENVHIVLYQLNFNPFALLVLIHNFNNRHICLRIKILAQYLKAKHDGFKIFFIQTVSHFFHMA